MREPIKTMGLYVNVDQRVQSELESMGFSDDDPLPIEKLFVFDQLHYDGTNAIQKSINMLGITSESEILEVGSGIGGASRCLVQNSGCHVTALELQKDLHDIGSRLTARCRLSEKIDHRNGDILLDDLDGKQFDIIASWLVFLHIPYRGNLFNNCFNRLKTNGQIYIEDYTRINDFSESEADALKSKVYCTYLPTAIEYFTELESAGFDVIQTEDMSTLWRSFVHSRLQAFKNNKSSYIDKHGIKSFDQMMEFYSAVDDLYQGGNLGGIRLLAKKN